MTTNIPKWESKLLDLFVETDSNCKNSFQYKGKWYIGKFGCDTLDHINELILSILKDYSEGVEKDILGSGLTGISMDGNGSEMASEIVKMFLQEQHNKLHNLNKDWGIELPIKEEE